MAWRKSTRRTGMTVYLHKMMRDEVFLNRYVKVIPLVNRRYLKEVPFLSKTVYQRERVGPRGGASRIKFC